MLKMPAIMSLFVTIATLMLPLATAFLAIHPARHSQHTALHAAAEDRILVQSDTSMFGRGEMHLSAMLHDGDVIAYQTGRWMVDGVWVGSPDDDAVPQVELACVDTIQVVWTHNCEHGVVRGLKLEAAAQSQEHASRCVMVEPIEFVELGPEQLLAKIPVEWADESSDADGSQCSVANFVEPIVLDDLLHRMPDDM